MAGYSGTPLLQKIGVKPRHRLVVRNAPATFLTDLGPLPEGVTATDKLTSKANVVVYFTDELTALQKDFSALAGTIEANGMVWVAWPKRASGRRTDLSEDVVRRVALERGLVDVKVCAIDDTWSGLKLVIRLKDRPTAKASARKTANPMQKHKEK